VLGRAAVDDDRLAGEDAAALVADVQRGGHQVDGLGDPPLFIRGWSSLLDHGGCRHETPHSDSYIFRKDPFVYHEPTIQALSVSVSGFTVLE
jgi:hypothetical protein